MLVVAVNVNEYKVHELLVMLPVVAVFTKLPLRSCKPYETLG